ncbi:aspartyl-phosphate phosphatase Spo0E family protein [Neobacillus sp. MM2021_6]|uniref:aspartyl-phosphate phosphatase Spo0E family protein n=1 Tax=Bacillaceae TaxID=186817 RepID=UPI00140B9475|nr:MULTISPECIES: aspartyl-phosphate phosphatase Spo0E family protein [Bacillaceae]MBO0962513.1 aspartyl-phosphate phosphatase Spo0E family protein [Neobacillus sp. MM2021_6]NHC21009.1 aspartyl-phosphate phosphatase Spo0E family protein [Bacillus sp. MM2020_4]
MLTMPINDKKSNLLLIIKSLRKDMIQAGLKDGLASKKTIAISQQLDEYIAKYQMI